MKNKFELIVNKKNETIMSYDLADYINKLRELEYNDKKVHFLLTNSEVKRGKSVKLRHDSLLNIIRDEFKKDILLQKILERKYIVRGREYPCFELTFNQAKQILVRESTYIRRAVIEYIEFLENELKGKKQKKNEEWLQTRLEGKIIRRKVTDMIKELIPYAIRQGCSNTKFFYSNYSKLANKTAGIENGTRDKVSMMLLNRVAEVENIFSAIIKQSMDKDIHYKEIYKMCKNRGEELERVFNVNIKELSYENK